MATPSDQLPPWETAAAGSEPPPPWETASAPAPEVPPWETPPLAVPQGQIQAPDTGSPQVAITPDSSSQIDKNNSFLSRWYTPTKNALATSPVIPTGPYHALNQFATGLDQTVLGVVKAPGQAAEAILNLAPALKGDVYAGALLNTLGKTSELINKFQQEFIDDPRKEVPFVDQLSQGAGSALAFMGMGGLLSSAGWSPTLATAATGGAVGASQQYDDAVAHGATPEQAAIAYMGGAAFGLTEAFPGAIFLNKFNAITGGKLLESIKTYGTNIEGSTAWEAVKGGLEEALQEGVQQIGQNWVAKDLAGYDPNRTLGEGFWQNVATGGIIGSLLGGGINMLRNGEKNRILKEMGDEYSRRMDSGDLINSISGHFTPVQDLIALRVAQNAANADYNSRVDAAVARAAEQEFAAANGEQINTDIIPPQQQAPYYLGNQADESPYVAEYLSKGVDSKIEKALPKRDTPYTVGEALDHTPVVVVDGNPYKQLLNAVEANLAKFEAQGLTTGAGYKILQQRRIELIAKSDIASRIMSQVKAYTAAFQQVFGPDYKMVLTAYSPTLAGEKGTAGFFNHTSGVTLPSGNKADIGYIFLKVDELATEIYNNKKAALNDSTKQARRALFETLNHELGHGIAITNLQKIYATISSETSTPAQRLGANHLLTLMTETYQEWLKTAAGKSQGWLLMTQFAPERAINYGGAVPENQLQQPMTAALPKGWPAKEYLLSFDEFFAEMTSRLATQGTLADPIMTKYFSSVLPQYQELFKQMPSFVKSEYGQDWRSFLVKNTTTYKVNQELEKVQAGGGSDLIGVLRRGFAGHEPGEFRWPERTFGPIR
jgi:hypothetical protein